MDPVAKGTEDFSNQSEIEEENIKSEEKIDLSFSEPDEFSDIVLIVEERKIHFYKLCLAKNSPVFKAMLFGPYKEQKEKEIQLPEKKHQDMVRFLKMMDPSFSDFKLSGKNLYVL